MGYLAAVLRQHGRSVEMIDVRDGPERIGERLLASPPLVVGFSLIFQFFLPQYRRLAAHLRAIGIDSHFTIGGHYPSLCHDEVLANFPEIDSVARFEGEMTLLELVQRLGAGEDWREVAGLAFLQDGAVVEILSQAASGGPRRSAVSLSPKRARPHRRLRHPAPACQPRLRAAVLVLLEFTPSIARRPARRCASARQNMSSRRCCSCTAGRTCACSCSRTTTSRSSAASAGNGRSNWRNG